MERSIETLNLDGGCACFDFINTVHSRKDTFVFDYLQQYDDWMKWCKKTGLLSPDRIKKLMTFSREHPVMAKNAFAYGMNVREAMYRLFSSIAHGFNPDKTSLEIFNQAMTHSLKHLRFTISREGKSLTWNTDTTDLHEPLWYIMKSAFDIWTNEEEIRIKECESCGWIFLDKTKNNGRRWCNMQACGSNDKALRYYYRKKGKR